MATNDDRETPPAASSDSFHADVLEALVCGAAGATSEDLQALYEAVAPVAYRGTTETPVKSRWRFEILASLQADERVASYETPRGRVWIPRGEAEPEGGGPYAEP